MDSDGDGDFDDEDYAYVAALDSNNTTYDGGTIDTVAELNTVRKEEEWCPLSKKIIYPPLVQD